MSLVVVGSVAYDGVETPHGKVDRMLGGACSYIALSASYFTPSSIVAVVGDDFAQEDGDLLASKRHRSGRSGAVPGKTFFWAGVYSDDMNDRTTLRTDLNVFADFNRSCRPPTPRSLICSWATFSPICSAGAQQMNALRFAGGDTMNYWINDFRDELLAAIRNWDFLLINDSEARMLSGENNLREAAQRFSIWARTRW